ncbi:cupin domain-containing protein [Aquabacterium sp.]|uniref:cupin domain-containing protein n=1 Tax=Aquabacterium sp. TaxID=1872578 RepID=UPI002BC5A3F8|nr:cupin domain-containing protein [Aquabacterium sp.]HSW03469.1 cupin domain-containing protein [Aquabacterium sp.]
MSVMSNSKYPPALNALDVAPPAKQTTYPEPFATWVGGREKRRLGEAFGLSNFGVNLTRLKPGAVSSVRHGHSKQEEFVYILEGAPTLVTDSGPTRLAPGMCAGFKAGSGDAHHLKNDTAEDVWYLEVGDRTPGDAATYPDDDLAVVTQDGAYLFTRKDGSPHA